MIHDSADVSDEAIVHETSKVWHLAQIREGAQIGSDCVIGRGVYIGPNVKVGASCKIQNHAQVFDPARIGNGVFIGPSVILTNDKQPRAVTDHFALRSANDWQEVAVVVDDGASIGAGAICVAPVRIGKWAMVGAGAVVVRDVPDFALVIGAPAKFVGWIGRDGNRLELNATNPNVLTSKSGGFEYRVNSKGLLEEIENS